MSHDFTADGSGALPNDAHQLPPNQLEASPSPASNAPHAAPLQVSSESPSSVQRADNASVGHARRSISQGLDWPQEFSLDNKDGCSNVFVGLSSEFDPSLLRHYLYNMHDVYPMFR